MSNLDELVDKKYRGLPAAEILNAPVSALMGVSKGDEELLIKALAIRTVGDLANHWSVRKAQAITQAAASGVSLMAHAAEVGVDHEDVTDDGTQAIANIFKPTGDTSLAGAWTGMQVYCYYALNLPIDDASLKLTLKTDDLGKYTFAPVMETAYGQLHTAATNFLNDVYDGVVSLGQALKDFAGDAADPDGIFANITQLIDSKDTSDALALLEDRIQQATENAATADTIKQKLTAFKTALAAAGDKVAQATTQVESDSATSQATIDLLSGDDDVIGSLKQIHSAIKTAQAEYQHDVVVASTTVTYAWVGPVGLVAAAIVAGIFGSRAVDELDAIDKLEAKLKTASDKLSIAVAAHNVSQHADTSLTETLLYTNKALDFTNVIQTGWQQISADLDSIKTALQHTVSTDSNGQDALRAGVVVKIYVHKATAAWVDAKPSIDALVNNAYIVVKPGATDWSKMMDKIKADVAKQG